MTTINGWGKMRLDQIGTVFSGSTPSTIIESFWDGNIVWVTPNDLAKLDTPYLADSERRITEKGLNGCSAQLLPAGSLVISSRAPIGYVAIPIVPFCTNQGCKSLRLKSGFHSEFVYYNMLFNIDELKKYGEGTTFSEISKTALSSVESAYPTNKSEQIKIADILLTVDHAIEQTEALIAKQQRIKTGLMQDLLTRGIDEHGNLRSEETHQFKDSPLGRIPVEWEVIALSDAGTWSSGGTPPRSTPRFWGDEVPWVCPKDMKTFDLTDTIDSLTEVGAKYGSKLMPAGTVFIVIRGMILAHTFPVGNAIRSMAFNQDIKAVVTRPNIEGRYLAYWLSAHGHDILKIATTATHGTKRFDMDDLLAVNVAVPTLSEQSRIVRAFDELQQAIDLNNKHAKKLRSLKTALMQDLLTGKVRVTPLLDNEEVSSE
jgi:type I restriction enzyme S subunit